MAETPLIRVLSEEVVNRIAAGEVVERPASVVKELIENSIDAGARRVEVEVGAGGRALIRVTDDGSGMGPEDLALSFVPHATSKLGDVEDLEHIGTLGFRGEALASIGAVSSARILSRQRGRTSGHEVRNEFGEVSSVRPHAAPSGTIVEVKEIFRNVPVRSKFLRSTGAEMARITETVQRFAVSHPELEFALTHDGRTVVSFGREEGRRERLARAYGRHLREELIEAETEVTGIHLFALLAPPSRTYRDSSRILLFLNGRYVRDRALLHAVRRAYDDLIFGGRNPVAFVFLTMDPRILDPNVHPAKLEVRFRDSGSVYSLLHREVRGALTRSHGAHDVPVGEPEATRTEEGERSKRVKEAISDYLASGAPGRRSPATGELFGRGSPGAGRRQANGPVGRAVDFLQVRNSFLVLEEPDGITIVDQHALHERVLYDRIRKRYRSGEGATQRLLQPIVVELAPADVELLLGEKESLERMGLYVEAFGRDALAVHGLPAGAERANPATIVEGVLERLSEGGPGGREDLVDRILATLACKSAVKAGDPLDREQVAELLEQAEMLEHSQTCPHGRPTRLRLKYDELERRFKRKG